MNEITVELERRKKIREGKKDGVYKGMVRTSTPGFRPRIGRSGTSGAILIKRATRRLCRLTGHLKRFYKDKRGRTWKVCDRCGRQRRYYGSPVRSFRLKKEEEDIKRMTDEMSRRKAPR